MEIANRSLNAELLDGMTDGAYKKMPPNRGAVEMSGEQERRLFLWPYGFAQAPYMITPDGRKVIPSRVNTGWDREGKPIDPKDEPQHWMG